jgi:exodeoxyribonuclease III
VVCLQELKAPQAKFPAAAIERAGYGAVWHGQSRWNGVAILARDAEPILTRRGLARSLVLEIDIAEEHEDAVAAHLGG